MDVIEQFLHSISYKFPKGYPDMDNPEDVTLLNEIISNLTEETPASTGEDAKYDKLIRDTLGVKEGESIPQPKGTYSLKGGTFIVPVKLPLE